jgi:Protein of unknown function (DUF3987)
MTMAAIVEPLIEGERITMHEPHAPGCLPLFPAMPAAERYPVDALGPILANAAAAIARKVQAPEPIAGQAVLAAASLVAQAHADVMMPFGQTRPLSLYMATIAGSGDRKSSADNEALWPIRKRERALKEAYERDIQSWSIEEAAWKAERRQIEINRKLDASDRCSQLTLLGPEPKPPLYPFLTAPDPTVEGLAKAWVSAPASLGLFTAEGGQFVGGHGMSLDQRLKTAATYSQIWDGHPIKRVRAGDGVTILSGRRLAMHIMIQPEAASMFLADSLLRDQGLLSRILVCAPDSIAGTRLFREVDADAEQAIKAYGARLLSILEVPWPLAVDHVNELEPRILTLTDDAKATWRVFYDHVERQSGPGSELTPVKDVASKIAEQAIRIGGVLSIIEDLEAAVIDKATMNSAVVLADWYLNEAIRMHGVRTDPRLVRSQQLLEWLQARRQSTGEDAVFFRDILRLGPNPVRTKSKADDALALFVEHEWIEAAGEHPRLIRLLGAAS